MRKLLLAIAISLPLASCGQKTGVEYEAPKVECIVTNVVCQYTLARGAYNSANNAVIAASRANLISTSQLEIATKVSDEILIALEAAKVSILNNQNATAESIIEEVNDDISNLRSMAPQEGN